MSESSDSNSISSSEESESTQSQGNRSQSSAQESQTGSDNEESKNSSPENRIETEERPRQREPTNWEAKYPYRFHPERDALMKECVRMAEYTMKPPIVKPWNPAKGRANNRGNYRGQNRNEQNHGGKRRRDF